MIQVSTERTLYAFDGWLLSPEGAAIHPCERTAVIADVHLGYEWARGASGDYVPAHTLEETLERLALVLDRAPISRMIVAGDLVESARPCPRTDHDIRRLRAWLRARSIRLTVLAGNHDRRRPPADSSTPAEPPLLPDCLTVANWTIGHGDHPIAGSHTISGHHHPALKLAGTTAPCFLLGPGRIILPAFSQNAAGFDLLTAALPRVWLRSGFRCVASTGEELLDFGSLSELRRLRSGSRASFRIRR
jgi:putative SbcD/Mre11-related phosphoesterase